MNYKANTHPFRPLSTYIYLGGPAIEGSAWLIEPQCDGQSGCRLMLPPTDLEDAVWTGETISDSEVADHAGIKVESVVSPGEFEQTIAGRNAAVLPVPWLATAEWVQSMGLEAAGRAQLLPIIEMRLIKDEHEIDAMRTAAAISIEAHRAAVRTAQPGRRESDVAAAFFAILIANMARPAFMPSITINGDVLHTSGFPNALEAGRLLLVDAGAEEPGGYACDITRTYPVGGSFNDIQRQLYETVLDAQQHATAACVPGRRFRDIHDIAAERICVGLVDADILRGDPAELAGRRAHRLFFTHGLGHLIGLDVHDMEDFGDLAGYAEGRTRRTGFGDKFLRLDRDLESGMTLTIEPGIYLVPAIWRQPAMTEPFKDCVNRPLVDKLVAGRFGGIRIEHTIHVTDANGPEILSESLETDPDAVSMLAAP